ncbi:hypothetical protein [Jannaschia sp. 2305UL9-9]|uniref:hypothetical protein n=1 Tax=Jannaschia sp. 2305UL9-9 TaxID=3121638 RepID=UPI003528B64F
MRRLILAGLFGALGGVVQAETPLTPDALLDRLVGGAATFTNPTSGRLLGMEFFPSRQRSFWQGQDGECSWGDVTVDETTICFRYDEAPDRLHCWLPFTDGDQIAYRSVDTGEVQTIAPRRQVDFACTDDLTS